MCNIPRAIGHGVRIIRRLWVSEAARPGTRTGRERKAARRLDYEGIVIQYGSNCKQSSHATGKSVVFWQYRSLACCARDLFYTPFPRLQLLTFSRDLRHYGIDRSIEISAQDPSTSLEAKCADRAHLWGYRECYTPVRDLARPVTLSRSSFKARLLSSSKVGGIAANAASVAMSFASAMLAFKSFNSRSMLSNVVSDKLLSAGLVGIDGNRCRLLSQ